MHTRSLATLCFSLAALNFACTLNPSPVSAPPKDTPPKNDLIAIRDRLPQITITGNPGKVSQVDDLPTLGPNGKPLLDPTGKPLTHRVELSAFWRFEGRDGRIYLLTFPPDVTHHTPMPEYMLYVRSLRELPTLH